MGVLTNDYAYNVGKDIFTDNVKPIVQKQANISVTQSYPQEYYV